LLILSNLFFIASQFNADVTEITPLGNGLINDTYLAVTPSGPFVLQRINPAVFAAPEQIMENLALLNRHLAQKDSAAVKLQIPEIVKTRDNAELYREPNGDCWRALSFIADTESIEILGTVSDAEQVGFALAHFHRLVSDLNPLLLNDTLPGFHITPEYLKHYDQISQQPVKPENRYCAEFIAQLRHIAGDLETAAAKNLLFLRVIHGDPKLNNFLFNKHDNKIASLIDLDTVKPGLVHYDIGDCIRSCCHIAEPAGFNLDICAALLKSYLAEAGAFFTEHDYHYLYPAIRLIPFELGIRFYSDYLQGNLYFKVTEPEQNLERAINQFRLCESIMKLESTLKNLISQLHQRNY
jgi:Ser/Thr protein kinase RdoA (MazF antagonist)